jgi:hypothetical protein
MNNEVDLKSKNKVTLGEILIKWALPVCIVANLLALVYQFGWFITWKRLPNLPSEAIHIVDADGDNVWVEGADGHFYTLTLNCGSNTNCKQWQKLDVLANMNPLHCQPVDRGATCKDLEGYFSPNNPLGADVNECIVADGCFPDPEYGYETYFALLSDGSIRYWQHGNGLMSFFGGFILSTCVLPALAVVVASFVDVFKKPKAG